jgi:small-conductance mechanosensitive channel
MSIDFLYTLHPLALIAFFLLVGVLLATLARHTFLWLGYKVLKTKYPELASSVRKRMRISLNLFFPILIFNILIHGDENIMYIEEINHCIRIAFIITISSIVVAVTNVLEDLLYMRFEKSSRDPSETKRIKSQVSFIKKILLIFIVIIAVSLVLMSFSKVRELGTSILASAGIMGVILGFAAQKSISNLLAGVEIAFNHSLKIDDFVYVEKEYGRVEEINLTSVVVKLWDQRRMILPITYFTDKPFENWTRNSSEITVSIFMHLDYRIPIDEMREFFIKKVQALPLWDGNTCKMIISDFSEKTMQVRATMSASDPDKAFELRALIREDLIQYLKQHHSDLLPRILINNTE